MRIYEHHARMTARLDKRLKREITVHGAPYIVTIAPEGLKLTPKGRRKGRELAWSDLAGDDATLAVALNGSRGSIAQPVQRSEL